MGNPENIFSTVINIPIGDWFDAENRIKAYAQTAVLYRVDDRFDPTKGIEILAMKDLAYDNLLPEDTVEKIVDENFTLVWTDIKKDVIRKCGDYIKKRERIEN